MDFAALKVRPVTRWTFCETSFPSIETDETATFLNLKGSIRYWNDPAQEKLWLYNLHYFEDLVATNAGSRLDNHQRLVGRWIKENPAAEGNGWEPYPTSLRIVNWVKWWLNGVEPNESWLSSLQLQAHVLSQNLEYHLLGNHLFANAKALVFAGTYLEGEQANAWLNKGLAILDKQIPEQILADGGNFELSPMYHSIMLLDILDLINLAQTYPKVLSAQRLNEWRVLAEKMLNWLQVMSHKDGEISLFNDAAMRIAPTPDVLREYARGLNISSRPSLEQVTHLAESGYIRVEKGAGTAILDVAKVGPDYIPGHAHADTLSFEWSFGRQRVFVNSGTSCYGLSDERLRQRKTAAHNTVEVNGLDSTEVWSGFRVARRAYPTAPELESNKAILVKASHDGYHRLKPKITHCREWCFDESSFSVKDTLQGKFDSALAFYHLHPDIRVVSNSETRATLTLANNQILNVEVNGGKLAVSASSWHPEFGLSVASKKLVIQLSNPELTVKVSW